MRRWLVIGVLLVTGCRGLVGPFERRNNPERIDDPGLSLDEQQRRGRDRLALPETSGDIAPRTYTEYPGASGR